MISIHVMWDVVCVHMVYVDLAQPIEEIIWKHLNHIHQVNIGMMLAGYSPIPSMEIVGKILYYLAELSGNCSKRVAMTYMYNNMSIKYIWHRIKIYPGPLNFFVVFVFLIFVDGVHTCRTIWSRMMSET